MNCLIPTVVALVFSLSGVANSQSIVSANFAQNKESGGTKWDSRLDPKETTGVVPAANWNNLDVLTAVEASPQPLILNDGTPSSVTVTWSSETKSQSVASIGSGSNTLALSPDEKIFKDYLRCGPSSTSSVSITVSGLPHTFTRRGYSVYVYFDQQSGRREQQAFTLSGSVDIYTDVPPGEDFVGTFKRAMVSEDSTASAGNYVLWEGLTSETFTIQTSALEANEAGHWSAGISGFQVVAAQ